jgi:hypothetical protein
MWLILILFLEKKNINNVLLSSLLYYIFFFKRFGKKIYNFFQSNNLEFTLKLKHLVFGYKISDNNYYGVNYFITILGFSIYKSYYLSEQKTKNVNVYKFFTYELNKRIDEIKNHSMNNSFLYAMKKKINSS